MKQKIIALVLLASLALTLFAACDGKEDILSSEEAYAIVYQHAGVDEGDAVDPHLHVVVEDGVTQYNIHFSAGSVSYDYYIHSVTGEIISADP